MFLRPQQGKRDCFFRLSRRAAACNAFYIVGRNRSQSGFVILLPLQQHNQGYIIDPEIVFLCTQSQAKAKQKPSKQKIITY